MKKLEGFLSYVIGCGEPALLVLPRRSAQRVNVLRLLRLRNFGFTERATEALECLGYGNSCALILPGSEPALLNQLLPQLREGGCLVQILAETDRRISFYYPQLSSAALVLLVEERDLADLDRANRLLERVSLVWRDTESDSGRSRTTFTQHGVV